MDNTDTQTKTPDRYWLLLLFAALGKAEPLGSNDSNGGALTNRYTNGWTDGEMLPSALSPSLL